jgi:flagellin-like protein
LIFYSQELILHHKYTPIEMSVGNIIGQPSSQDRAVSPVIAVILMVAITVILSAVIGTYVLGISDSLNDSPPNAAFSAEQQHIIIDGEDENDDPEHYTAVRITHESGEPVQKANLDVQVDGEPAYAVGSPSLQNPGALYSHVSEFRELHTVVRPWDDATPSKTISAGDTTSIVLGTDFFENSDYTVGPDGDDVKYEDCCDGAPDRLVRAYSDGSTEYIKTNSGARLGDGERVNVVWSAGSSSTVLFSYTVSDPEVTPGQKYTGGGGERI